MTDPQKPLHQTTQEPITRWMLTSVPSDSGRGDLDAAQLRACLHGGWEPFAVAEGRVWLRQKVESCK